VYSLLVSGIQRIIPTDLEQRKEIAKEIDSIIKEKSHLVNPNIVTKWSTIAAKIYYYKHVDHGREEARMLRLNEPSQPDWDALQIDILNLRTWIVHEYNQGIVPAYNKAISAAAGYTREFEIISGFPLKRLKVFMDVSQEAGERRINEKHIQVKVEVLADLEGFPVVENLARIPVDRALLRLEIVHLLKQQQLRIFYPQRTDSDGKHVFDVRLDVPEADKNYEVRLEVAHNEYASVIASKLI
jgi:hypothetical protein